LQYLFGSCLKKVIVYSLIKVLNIANVHFIPINLYFILKHNQEWILQRHRIENISNVCTIFCNGTNHTRGVQYIKNENKVL
jgi:hypothetical protein